MPACLGQCKQSLFKLKASVCDHTTINIQCNSEQEICYMNKASDAAVTAYENCLITKSGIIYLLRIDP